MPQKPASCSQWNLSSSCQHVLKPRMQLVLVGPEVACSRRLHPAPLSQLPTAVPEAALAKAGAFGARGVSGPRLSSRLLEDQGPALASTGHEMRPPDRTYGPTC